MVKLTGAPYGLPIFLFNSGFIVKGEYASSGAEISRVFTPGGIEFVVRETAAEVADMMQGLTKPDAEPTSAA